MSAFRDYYMVSVEQELSRKATEAETKEAKQLYIKGWHPARTAAHLAQRATDGKECTCLPEVPDLKNGVCSVCGLPRY